MIPDLDKIKSDKSWMPFGEEDPFHHTFVEGYICREQGDLYGALMLLKIDHEQAPQFIFCTPKLAYPFTTDALGQVHWRFPKARLIQRYEKLDGTNVFSFRYTDAKGRSLVSFKTRLTPLLRDSRFGPFLSMWKEMIRQYPAIPSLPLRLGMNLSYELWGARNPHLVRYTSPPLEASLLFARDGRKILPPSALGQPPVPTAPHRGDVDRDYIWRYQESQKQMDGTLRPTDDGGYLGTEGEVWYVQTEDGLWTPFKCKPETIEAIHWSSSAIDKNIILATCQNAFENWDDPTVDNVRDLLLEEFQPNEVEKVYSLIARCLDETRSRYEFRKTVLDAYRALGMDILTNKREVMRALSAQFPKERMSHVYTVIATEVAH